jgi:hypothetical protein
MIGNITLIAEDKRGFYVEIDRAEPACKWKSGERVSVDRKRAKRSKKQNSLYWAFLTWCVVRGGLRELGHWSEDAVHEDIKAWAKTTHPHVYQSDFSTSDLNKVGMGEFFEVINYEYMLGVCEINTAPFWETLDRFYLWQEFHVDGTFREFLDVV